MFKPLPNTATGILVEAIDNLSYEIVVSANLAAKVAALGPSDWTYLAIRYVSLYEIVKVVGQVGQILTVRRGQENTTPYRFPSGAVVGYVFTLSAIRDTVKAENLAQLTLTASGIAKYSKGNVDVTKAIIISLGYTDAVGYAPVALLPNEAFTGCKIVICGQIAYGPFYLTSKLYPLFFKDSLKTDTTLKEGRVLGEYFDSLAVNSTLLAGGSLRVLLRAYPHWPLISATDEALKIDSTLLAGGTLRVLLRSYPHWPLIAESDESLKTDSTLLPGGTLKILLIQYTNWLTTAEATESMKVDTTLLSGTLGPP